MIHMDVKTVALVPDHLLWFSIMMNIIQKGKKSLSWLELFPHKHFRQYFTPISCHRLCSLKIDNFSLADDLALSCDGDSFLEICIVYTTAALPTIHLLLNSDKEMFTGLIGLIHLLLLEIWKVQACSGKFQLKTSFESSQHLYIVLRSTKVL